MAIPPSVSPAAAVRFPSWWSHYSSCVLPRALKSSPRRRRRLPFATLQKPRDVSNKSVVREVQPPFLYVLLCCLTSKNVKLSQYAGLLHPIGTAERPKKQETRLGWGIFEIPSQRGGGRSAVFGRLRKNHSDIPQYVIKFCVSLSRVAIYQRETLACVSVFGECV